MPTSVRNFVKLLETVFRYKNLHHHLPGGSLKMLVEEPFQNICFDNQADLIFFKMSAMKRHRILGGSALLARQN